MIYESYIVGGVLYHHGIQGQKWGKRNGPPYPLKDSDHSPSEKKAGWKKSLNEQSGQKKKFDMKDFERRYKEEQKLAPEKMREAIKDVDNISKTVAKDAISDMKRWVKEPDTDPKEVAKMKEVLKDKNYQKYLETIIKARVKNASSPYYSSTNDTVNFVIDGIDEAYSDYAPITIEYDLKNKKVKGFGWT